jgi:hypothetical protein
MDVDPPLASSIHIYDCTLPLILGAACNHQNSVLNPAFTIYHGVGFKVVDIEVMRRRVIFGRFRSMRRMRGCDCEGLGILGGHGEARQPAWGEDHWLLPVGHRECMRRRSIRRMI